MKFQHEMILERNREEVWETFDSTENLYKWQPTLVSFEHVSGTPCEVGAISNLKYEEDDGREVVARERIVRRDKPNEFSGVYETRLATNHIENHFMELDKNRTLWTMKTEFEFSGVYRVLSILMRGQIKRRTEADMKRFKKLVEGDLTESEN